MKISLFLDDMIIYVDNSIEFMKKSTRNSEFRKMTGYKMCIYNPTNNQKLKFEKH